MSCVASCIQTGLKRRDHLNKARNLHNKAHWSSGCYLQWTLLCTVVLWYKLKILLLDLLANKNNTKTFLLGKSNLINRSSRRAN